MIAADVAKARQTAVLQAAMRHGNKIALRQNMSAVAGHRRFHDFNHSFRAVYCVSCWWPLTGVVGKNSPARRVNLADIAIGAH
jgi:hypothetical protein